VSFRAGKQGRSGVIKTVMFVWVVAMPVRVAVNFKQQKPRPSQSATSRRAGEEFELRLRHEVLLSIHL
jgi:ABC-type uncharacterized transport system permease subunit